MGLGSHGAGHVGCRKCLRRSEMNTSGSGKPYFVQELTTAVAHLQRLVDVTFASGLWESANSHIQAELPMNLSIIKVSLEGMDKMHVAKCPLLRTSRTKEDQRKHEKTGDTLKEQPKLPSSAQTLPTEKKILGNESLQRLQHDSRLNCFQNYFCQDYRNYRQIAESTLFSWQVLTQSPIDTYTQT